MDLKNKKIIINFNKEIPHYAEYFFIKYFKKQYFLFYGAYNKIYLIISKNINNFDRKNAKIIIREAPGGCFSIIEHNNSLFMLCGCHISNKEKGELDIPNLVWNKTNKVTDPKVYRKDRKNGMYLLKSNDGINWENLYKTPVLHSFVKSENIKLGEICFDTSPYLIKFNNKFFYFGRLNSSMDERRVYVRTSDNLKDWSEPFKINIINERNNKLNKNYYNMVVFSYNNKLYAFTPYFEACGTIKRICSNGKTLLLSSNDGYNWKIINECLKHSGKYKTRVNDIFINKNKINIFFRDNLTNNRKPQDIISYETFISNFANI